MEYDELMRTIEEGFKLKLGLGEGLEVVAAQSMSQETILVRVKLDRRIALYDFTPGSDDDNMMFTQSCPVCFTCRVFPPAVVIDFPDMGVF